MNTQTLFKAGMLAALLHTGAASAAVITFDDAHFPLYTTVETPFVGPYQEDGFTVTLDSANWFGNGGINRVGVPSSFIYFKKAADQDTVVDGVQVTNQGHLFSFDSVQIYSSISAVPYVFTGMLGSTVVFKAVSTLPNPEGDFVTVYNPYNSALIDTLKITLTDPANANFSGDNPVGISHISVTSSVPEPVSLALGGVGLIAVLVQRRMRSAA